MRVVFQGVRGSCPAPGPATRRFGGNTSSVALHVDGEPPLLLDLGTGVRHTDAGATGPDRPFRAAALVTHVHLDHVQGLPFFPPVHRPGTELDVYGPAQEGGSLAEAFAGFIGPPYFPLPLADFNGSIRFHEVGDERFSIGTADVTARLVPHRGPTLGYRITWGGATVAYVSDHQAPPGLDEVAESVLELAADADLLVHDAQYTPAEFAEKPDWGHSTVGYALRVARLAGARRLCLFHHDPARTDDELDVLVAAARDASRGSGIDDVVAAAEGTTLAL